MKKVFGIIICLFMAMSVMMSCSKIKAQTNELKHKDLYAVVDNVVNSLYTTYESYGLLGGTKQYAENMNYQVLPIGRLVNVKILSYATMEDYEELRSDLELHYKNDYRVKRVYICGYGTIMVDCRR